MTPIQNQLTSFFLVHPKEFLYYVSEFYPFTREQILEYKNLFRWEGLSYNKNIKWDGSLLELFTSEKDWQILSGNCSVFKQTELIDQFIDRIVWTDPRENFQSGLSCNWGLPWTENLIEKYEKYWNFRDLSGNLIIPWSEALIDKYFDRWNWLVMSGNMRLPWSVAFIKKYENQIHKKSHEFLSNDGIVGNLEIVLKYGSQLQWDYIWENNRLPWVEENLLERWKEKINLEHAVQNPILMKDTLFLEARLDIFLQNPVLFCNLSSNWGFPWSVDMLERFEDFWNWKALSLNDSLPWSKELVSRYDDRLFWGETDYYVSRYDGVLNDLSAEERHDFPLKKYFKYGLSDNIGIPWSLDFIKAFSNRWHYEMLFNNGTVWEKVFLPHLDEKMLNVIFRLLS